MSFVVGSNIEVDDGTFIRCPFNSTHRIVAERFPYHFIKCKDSYPGVEVTHCPYNAKHCLRKEELADHIVKCPQRSKIDPVIVKPPNGTKSAIRPITPQCMVDKSLTEHAAAPAPATTTNYVSYTSRALNGELLEASLAELSSTSPK